MSLENLSKPALETLLAFHVEAADTWKNDSSQLRSASGLQKSGSYATLPEQSWTSGPQLPFSPTDLRRRSSAPSPSQPSTPVRRVPGMPSSPAVGTWPVWSMGATSPTPGPRHSPRLDRKRRRGNEENEYERLRRRIDPGWPRGFIRTPSRKRRLWEQENERREVQYRGSSL
ncbi:hypothetical protein B0H13DRAFT_1897655 [Mycena leptocephala]|nr:hypothetical protein B0H13DRAFT_1897655 [Mycena leptocephala]